MRRLLSLSLALWLVWAWADAPAWISRAETITPTDLRAHLEFIASDELEGRDTPSRGLDLAGMYIVSHLQRWGVKPAGENGTYYQTLRFRTDAIDPAETRIRISGQSFEYGVGFVARPVALNATAPLVYVGNGWSNPDKGIDPYAGLEVAGKVLVVQAGYPKEVIEQGLDAAPTAGWRSPEQNAEEKGALAILRIDPSDMERIERIARAWSQRRVVEGLQPVSSIPVIVASAPMLNALFAGEQVVAAELIRRANDNDPAPSFALSPSKQISITLSVQTRVEAARSVIGMIEGSDPVLKREYVSLGAHLDHVGVSARGEGTNRIFNGADDNGDLSGPNEVYVIGPNIASPDIGAVLKRVNDQYLRMELNPMYDSLSHPEQLFFRSDHYSFVSKGIPAVFFFTGLHADYHQVTDSVEKIDFEKMARVARTVFGLAWELADAPERPARVNLEGLQRRR
jgi:hypothetical protein